MTTTYLTQLPDGRLAARTSKDAGLWTAVVAEPRDDGYLLLWQPSQRALKEELQDRPTGVALPVIELPYGRQRAVANFKRVQALIHQQLEARLARETKPARPRRPRPGADVSTRERRRCRGACHRMLPITKFPTMRGGERGSECRKCRDARRAEARG